MPGLRWKTIVLALACATGCGAGTTTGAPPEEPPEEVASAVDGQGAPDAGPATALLPPAFPESELVSYFANGEAAEALEQYRRQEFALADAAIRRALVGGADDSPRRALRILQARIQRELGHWGEAAKLFAAAVTDNPTISDYLHYEAARAFARAGEPAASRHASLVDAHGPWGGDMEFLLAEASRARGEASAAEVRYRSFLEKATAPLLVAEARYRLGEVLRAQDNEDAARTEWRLLLVTDPTSAWTEELRKHKPTLDASLSTDELLTRGMAYFHAMRNLESSADFASALSKGGLSAEQRCQALFHRAKSLYKERDYKKAAPRFVPAIAACKSSGNTNYEVKSAYQAGLAFARTRDYQRSAQYFRYIEQYPKHSYADDARLRQAEQYDSLKNDAKVRELLSAIPKLYPGGDMQAEAMWRLARRAYMRKDYPEAVKWLSEQIRLVPIESNWWAEGQAHYWLGRTQARHNKTEEAVAAYRECIRRYPLTYYSMQSFARLKESFPAEYAAAVQEVQSQESPWSGTLRDRDLYAGTGFRTALELARLGIGDAAYRQLEAIGMGIPEGRKAEHDDEVIDRLIATSSVLDLGGDYAHSHWPGRWHAVDYRRSWPTGTNRRRWRLAYPLAFWTLLQQFAETYSYPSHLQMAIVREESAFDPSRESWANAIGLTQMIFPTAIDHSKESGIAVTRQNLQHPVKNVTIGSHFLQSLQDAFEGRVGLMVPGYNAGRARVRGWIRQRSRYDLDEFIELIPGDQARRYTKRVLGSFFAYTYLSEGVVPDVRNAVPGRLGHLGRR